MGRALPLPLYLRFAEVAGSIRRSWFPSPCEFRGRLYMICERAADLQHQVAVAKHLGLVALRVTDSIILPLNTTQYALELDSYVDKYVTRYYGSRHDRHTNLGLMQRRTTGPLPFI